MVRHMDETKRRSKESIMYDAEERWRLGLTSDGWAIGDIGEREWSSTLYICKMGWTLFQLEVSKEAGIEDKWR